MNAPRPGSGRTDFRTVILPFIIFTSIWGSTWIVIRDQLGTVPPQWSVAYRFVIAAAAMLLLARLKGDSLRLDRGLLTAAILIGLAQFCLNFNMVYLAEQHITSGVVATFFALVVIPSSLLGWAFLDQRPSLRFVFCSLIAIAGIGMMFAHELDEHSARSGAIMAGLAFTLIGMLAAAAASVLQARPEVRRYPLFSLLAWSMIFGVLFNLAVAAATAGPPMLDSRPGYWVGLFYLAIPASVLTFILFYPVVRKIGPGKAAYSAVLVPIIAMGLSTIFEGYRWTPLAAAGALLALGGMAGALTRPRSVVPAADAA